MEESSALVQRTKAISASVIAFKTELEHGFVASVEAPVVSASAGLPAILTMETLKTYYTNALLTPKDREEWKKIKSKKECKDARRCLITRYGAVVAVVNCW